MTTEMHVLLAEHDTSSHSSIRTMLEHFSYKVTSTKLAATALSILSKGEVRFDLVLANINSPDSCGYRLVEDAVKMDLPVFLITDEDVNSTKSEGLDVGTFLYLKKPVTIEMIKYLDQNIWRMKIRSQQIQEIMQNQIHNEPEQQNSMGSNTVNNLDNDNEEEHKPKKKKKPRTRWTQELHEKFVEAIKLLGEGGCYPQDILEIMNVPGLTRMQVASHLQRCREGTWKPPKDRNLKASLKANCPRRPKTRLGLMPKCHLSVPVQGDENDIQIEDSINPSIQTDTLAVADEFVPGSTSFGEAFQSLFPEDPIGLNSFSFDLEQFQLKQIGAPPFNIDNAILPDIPFHFGS